MFDLSHWISTTFRRRQANECLPSKTARWRGPARLEMERLEDRLTPALGFSTAVNYHVGHGPLSVTVGDFNGDSKADLAASVTTTHPGDLDPYNFSVLLGDGSGGFGNAASFQHGDNPTWVTVGDFNGDAKADLAMSIFYQISAQPVNISRVEVLLGNGEGGFASPVNINNLPAAAATSVAVGDFNEDGNADLAVTIAADRNSSVYLFFGDGSGGFSSGPFYDDRGGNPQSVTVGDLNGDGHADLATADDGNNKVHVLLGNGTGFFPREGYFDVGRNPKSVTVGDFNGDGKADLATANAGPNNVSVLLGNGSGGFGKAAHFGVGKNPQSVTVADFNGDGKADLATANQGSNNVSVLLGNGSGGFGKAAHFGVGQKPQSVTVADFNGDGRPDLATANQGSNDVSALLNIVVLGNSSQAPVAAKNVYYVVMNERLAIPNGGPRRAVLANDRGAEGVTLTAELVSGPSSGKLRLNADGSFVFVPKRDFKGTVTFTYRAFDGTKFSDPVEVTIVVFRNA